MDVIKSLFLSPYVAVKEMLSDVQYIHLNIQIYSFKRWTGHIES